MNPEIFPEKPLDPITHYGPTNFFADRHAKPGGTAFPLLHHDDEMTGMMLFPFAPNPKELAPTKQSKSGRKGLPHPRQHRNIDLLGGNGDDQVFAPPGPAPSDDGLPGFALHPLPKTVSPFPFDSTGLISSFHLLATPYGILLNDFWRKEQLITFTALCQDKTLPAKPARGRLPTNKCVANTRRLW